MRFQFKNHETFHLEIIENQINKEVGCISHNMLLPFHEGKATAKFKDKALKVVYEGLFQIRLGECAVSTKAHKFRHNRILDIIQWVFPCILLQVDDICRQLGRKAAFIVLCGDVAVKFRGTPHIARSGFQIP